MDESMTQKKLKELLDYDQYTGIFIWRSNRGNQTKKGDIAGSVNSRGYFK